jgi:hypothetical protein
MKSGNGIDVPDVRLPDNLRDWMVLESNNWMEAKGGRYIENVGSGLSERTVQLLAESRSSLNVTGLARM